MRPDSGFGKESSDDVAYFELLKDLPGCPAGESFSVTYDEGEPFVLNGAIRFPAYFTVEHTDWFRPVYMDEYRANFKKSFMYYAQNDRGCTPEEAERKWNIFINER